MSRSYFVKKLLLRTIIALPVPRTLNRLLRFYVDTKAGENFGDMSINGEFAFLDEHGPACRVLFDVGAGDGEWTGRALRVNPQAQVHCFEPVRTHYQRLVARRFPSTVTCVASGLFDREGSANIFTTALSLHDRRGPGFDVPAEGESETIALTTLDAYCARTGIAEIDLPKVDTEGHEPGGPAGWRAHDPRGARPADPVRVRSAQRLRARVLRDFFLFFDTLPYTLYQVMPRTLARVTYTHRLENLQYKNFVALHESVSVNRKRINCSGGPSAFAEATADRSGPPSGGASAFAKATADKKAPPLQVPEPFVGP